MTSDGFPDSAPRANALHLRGAASAPSGADGVAASKGSRAPRTVADTGLELTMLVELVNKTSFVHGKTTLLELMSRLKLPVSVLQEVVAFSVREHFMEITHRGALDADMHLRLTDAGRVRTAEAMARCSYVGPAPVPLATYVDTVNAHSVHDVHITRTFVQAAFSGTTLDTHRLDDVAEAFNASRPLMLYGPAGTGKTYMAERLGELLEGAVPIPYAVSIDGEIIQFFDPLLHVPIDDAELSVGQRAMDRRWQLCERPVVLSSCELTVDMLEVSYDEGTGFYQAPPHMKANNGIYIIDDFGRQLVQPQELANRWILPLDRNIDMHVLRTGRRFSVPFDVWPVFSTNMDPWSVCDDAFLRRLGSKVYVGPLSMDTYRSVFDAECARLGLWDEPGVFEYLTEQLHVRSAKPLFACYPRDLLTLISAMCRYRVMPLDVTEALLDTAWHRYFEMNRPAQPEGRLGLRGAQGGEDTNRIQSDGHC